MIWHLKLPPPHQLTNKLSTSLTVRTNIGELICRSGETINLNQYNEISIYASDNVKEVYLSGTFTVPEDAEQYGYLDDLILNRHKVIPETLEVYKGYIKLPIPLGSPLMPTIPPHWGYTDPALRIEVKSIKGNLIIE